MKNNHLLRSVLILFCLILSTIVSKAQAPTVQQFAPLSGCANNTQVVITGTDFVNVTAVQFGGTNALSYIVNSPAQITAVPAAGSTGPITVQSMTGSGSSATSFNVISLPALPTGLIANPATLCTPDTVALSAVSAGNIINWYTVPTGGVSLGYSASGSAFPIFVNGTTTYYAEAATAAVGIPVTFNFSGTIVNYTVPPGIYSVVINAKGAQGGTGGNIPAGGGGLGADITGTFQVTPGQVLKILVGQQGGGSGVTAGAGGGGGSFVTDIANNPLVVAGGGGGRHGMLTAVGIDANSTNNGNNGYSAAAGYPNLHGIGGTLGNGALFNGQCSGNGAGLLSDGGTTPGPGCCLTQSGVAFINGGAGGPSCTWNVDLGGF